MLIQYMKDNKGRKRGVMVAFKIDVGDYATVGFSRCNLKKDKFYKDAGLAIAEARAYRLALNDGDIYQEFFDLKGKDLKQMLRFIRRCRRYFQDAEVLNPYRLSPSFASEN